MLLRKASTSSLLTRIWFKLRWFKAKDEEKRTSARETMVFTPPETIPKLWIPCIDVPSIKPNLGKILVKDKKAKTVGGHLDHPAYWIHSSLRGLPLVTRLKVLAW